MGLFEWAAVAILAGAAIVVWKYLNRPRPEPGTCLLGSDVDPGEFSRLFAKALLDERGRRLMGPLLQASGGWVTSRELAMLKFAIGEGSREALLQEIGELKPTSLRDAEILNRQVEILRSVMGAREENTDSS